MTTPNAFGVSDQLGSGGSGLAPDGASGPSDGTPPLRDLLRLLFGTAWQPLANTAAFQATIAANREDGQLAVRLSDYSLWIFEAASAAGASGTVIVPTDVGGGAGRWVQMALTAESLASLGIQTGSGTLTAGASGNIAATITSSTKIAVTRTAVNASTSLGELAVTNKTVGGPGHFVVDALTVGTPGTPLAADVSSFDWIAIG